MSYTMTMDMPAKATEYVERRGPRFRDELSAIVVAFVLTRMKQEAAEDSRRTGSAFARAWGLIGVADGELDLSRRAESLREIDFS